MDLITFKIQANRASQAAVIQSSDKTKRALLKTLYNEATMTGLDIMLTDTVLDDSGFIKTMTFGLRGNPRSENISEDTCLANVIPPGATLIAMLIENETGNACKLSFGVTPGGSEIAPGVEIAAGPELTTVPVINTFSLTEFKSIYVHHAGDGDAFNDAVLNINLLFK